MPTVEQLWNMAAGRIGERAVITDRDADTSEAARWCRVYYEPTRDKLLAEFDWPFARWVIDATELEDGAPPTPWLYSMSYPSACLAIRGYHLGTQAAVDLTNPAFVVSNPATRALHWEPYGALSLLDPATEPYRVGGETKSDGSDRRVVWTMSSGGYFRITKIVSNPNDWSAPFVDALAWFLARDLAQEMARSLERATYCEQMGQRALEEAKVAATRQATVRLPMTVAGAGSLDAVRA